MKDLKIRYYLLISSLLSIAMITPSILLDANALEINKTMEDLEKLYNLTALKRTIDPNNNYLIDYDLVTLAIPFGSKPGYPVENTTVIIDVEQYRNVTVDELLKEFWEYSINENAFERGLGVKFDVHYYPDKTTITPLEKVTAEKRFNFLVEGLKYDIDKSDPNQTAKKSSAGYIILEETGWHLSDFKPKFPDEL